MKIFGKNFMTKKMLRATNDVLSFKVDVLNEELDAYEDKLMFLREQFPFDMNQVVYDIALKNAKGRYTKTNPSLEHSLINEVVVDEKNYFNLVERYKRNDVFFDRDEAEEYLRSICK